MGFPGGSVVNNMPASNAVGTGDPRFPSREDPLEEEMATHSSILVRIIPWTEKSGKTITMPGLLDMTEHVPTGSAKVLDMLI